MLSLRWLKIYMGHYIVVQRAGQEAALLQGRAWGWGTWIWLVLRDCIFGKIYFRSSFTDAIIDSERYKGIPLWKVILPCRKLGRGFIFQNDSVLKLTSKNVLKKKRSRIVAYETILLRILPNWIKAFKHLGHIYSSVELYTKNKLLKCYRWRH